MLDPFEVLILSQIIIIKNVNNVKDAAIVFLLNVRVYTEKIK